MAGIVKKIDDFYNDWIKRQTETVLTAMRENGRSGRFLDAAVYVIPSAGSVEGRLVVADELPPGSKEVLSLGPHGTSIMRVPYSHVSQLLWNACRNQPVLPTEGPDA